MSRLFDFSSFPVLATQRLRLRPLREEDAEAIQALFGDPRTLRFLNQPPTDTPAKALELIRWLNGHYDRHEAVQWAITLDDDDRMIGTCGVYAWDRENRHVDIGYHILYEHWGQGYATEATRALLGWCFANLDVHRIQADCTDGNIASERVLLKCGFRLEGIWRESCWEHGRFVDIKQFGLLRREAEDRGRDASRVD
ncbi:MAG: GNAT family N-acetyltransferase [Caldilineaceae bacterium]|nr:GNAT family N-acetyltransferase [Caldilineaceae bacterium]